jgi:hypothetical protein
MDLSPASPLALVDSPHACRNGNTSSFAKNVSQKFEVEDLFNLLSPYILIKLMSDGTPRQSFVDASA